MADATSIRGIKIKLEGDASGLITALQRTKTEVNQTQRYLNDVNKLLKLDPKNVELVNQKFKYLEDAINQNKERLNVLRATAKELKPAVDETNTSVIERYKAVQREIATTEQKIKDLVKEQLKFKFDNNTFVKFGDGLKALGDKIELTGQKFERFAQLASGVTAFSVQSFADFESAFAGVKKTVDETYEGEYDVLQENIRKMATETASSAEEIAGVMEVAGQLAIPNEDLTEFTKTMIMLGDSTNLTAQEGAVNLAKFLNITNTSSDQIDRIGAAIVDLGNNFATQEQDIVDMSYYLASAGSAAGLSAQEILGLATAMSSAGIKAASGGSSMMKTLRSLDLGTNNTKKFEQSLIDTASAFGLAGDDADRFAKTVKSVVTGIGDVSGDDITFLQSLIPGKDEEERLENYEAFIEEMSKGVTKEGKFFYNVVDKMGVSLDDFWSKWENSPIEALKDFIKLLNNAYEEGDSLYVTMEDLGISEIRQSNMLRALSISYENFDDAINTANSAYDENTALVTEANKRYATFDTKVSQAKEKLKRLGAEMGSRLIPILEWGMERVETLMNIWDGLSDSTKTAAVAAIAAAGKYSLMTHYFAPIVRGAGSVVKGIGELWVVMRNGTSAVGVAETGLGKFGVAFGKVVGAIGGPQLALATAGLVAFGGAAAIVAKSWDVLGNSEKRIQSFFDELPDVKSYTAELYDMDAAFQTLSETTKGEILTADIEINGIEETWEKLAKITDENGKIKDGFEEQADILVGKINQALGTNLEIIDKQIVGYDEVAKNIDKVIAKKKADMYLNAFADDYEAALKGQQTATKTLTRLLQDKETVSKELNKILALQEDLYIRNSENAIPGYAVEMEELSEKEEALRRKLGEVNGELDNVGHSYETYSATIRNYAAVTAATETGSAQQIQDSLLKLKYNFIDASDTTETELQKQVTTLRNEYSNMKKAAESGVKGVTQAQVDELGRMVVLAETELAKMKGVYSAEGQELPKTFAQNYKSQWNIEKPALGAAVDDAIGKKFREQRDNALKWGGDLVYNFAEGMNRGIVDNKSKIAAFGNHIRSIYHFSVPDEGPLADADKWGPDFVMLFADGIEKGISKAKGKVDGFASYIATTMGGSTQFGIAANGANPNSVVNQYSSNMGGVNFVINAAAGQDVNEIANAVDEMLTERYMRAERAFAR